VIDGIGADQAAVEGVSPTAIAADKKE